jgi:hypothetical protein
MARSFLMLVAIIAMDRLTKTDGNSLDSGCLRADIKGTACPHQHPPNVAALFLSIGNHRSDHISRLKTLDLFCSLWLGAGETNVRDIAFAPTTRTRCRDEQGHHPVDLETVRSALAHTGRISPVGFLQTTDTRPLSINGTKNNAKELNQRRRIDQASLMVPKSLRWRCIAEDEADEWCVAGQFTDCFKREEFY